MSALFVCAILALPIGQAESTLDRLGAESPKVEASATPGIPAEITLEARKGWVHFRIEYQGRPIEGALVEVREAAPTIFAEGVTGSKGDGQFPLPAAKQFRLDVKIQEKWANTVLVTRIDDAVVPARVLLAYGSKPCCKVPRWDTDEESSGSWGTDFLPVWSQMALAIAMIGAGVWFSWFGFRGKTKTT